MMRTRRVYTFERHKGLGVIVDSRGRWFPYGPGYDLPINMQHRTRYTAADATAICEWLNKR